MPRPGQRSLTISEEVYQRTKEYFEKHRRELEAHGIASVPALFQDVALSFIGENRQEASLQLSLRFQIVGGFAHLFAISFSSISNVHSAAWLFNQSLQFTGDARTRNLQNQDFGTLADRFNKLDSELGNLMRVNVISEAQERRLSAIIVELVMLMQDYVRSVKSIVEDARRALPRPQAEALLKSIESWFQRYASIFVPYATLTLMLTGNTDQVFLLSNNFDSEENSLASVVLSIGGERASVGREKPTTGRRVH